MELSMKLLLIYGWQDVPTASIFLVCCFFNGLYFLSTSFKKPVIFLKIFTKNGKCCMHLTPSSEPFSNNLARVLPQLLMNTFPEEDKSTGLSVRMKAQRAVHLLQHTIGHGYSNSPQGDRWKDIHCPTAVTEFYLLDKNKSQALKTKYS